jgi:mRNA export factor
LQYWDCRQSTPALETTVPERIYCSAYTAGLAVACLADRNIAVYDMRNPSTPYRVRIA